MATCPICKRKIRSLLVMKEGEEGWGRVIYSPFIGSLFIIQTSSLPLENPDQLIFLCPKCKQRVTDDIDEATKILSREYSITERNRMELAKNAFGDLEDFGEK